MTSLTPPASRNAPCPCGSGKRFKDCHGAFGAAKRGRVGAQADGPEALFHRGNERRERGDYRGAIADYERALAQAPGHAALLNNLGLALEAVGDDARAESCYREVLDREPKHADAMLNLASVLSRSSRFAEAAALHANAATVRRDLGPAVWTQRALAQERLHDFAGAEESLAEAARLAPDDVRIQLNLATLLIRQRRHVEAEGPLQRALELDPGHAQALSMLAYVRQQRCAWEGLGELHERIRVILDRDDTLEGAFNPFPLLSMPLTLRQLQTAARTWARGFAAATTPAPPPSPAPSGRLRVGFVSSDFRPHATTNLLLEFWEQIDRSRLETFAYAIAAPDAGPAGQRIRRAFERFTDVSSDSAAAIAERIRSDGIGVLLDLNGYTRLARETIFALRPAPVQVSAFGYLGTLGAPWYDYVLTDPFASPAEAQPYFDERFLWLDCYCPGATGRDVNADAGTRRSHGLPERGFVFCCFNSSYKLLPHVFEVWMRLLAAVPESVLWLTQTRSDTSENLQRAAAAAGVGPHRLVFAQRVPLAEHLARHRHADLFLDTAPYNAGATANDALMMGLPVVTCAGNTMASRIAGSQLRAAGVPELVATRLADYEARALGLAREPGLLDAFRARLASRAGALFDTARYARGFEEAVERAWNGYLRASPD